MLYSGYDNRPSFLEALMKERNLLILMLYSTLVLSVAAFMVFLWTLLPQTRFQGDPYPRLGMWGLDPYQASVDEMSKYHLLIDNLDDPGLREKVERLKLQAPYQKRFKPIAPSERPHFILNPSTKERMANPELRRLPSEFFLSQPGTQITNSINASQTRVQVNALKDDAGADHFRVGGTVMLGKYESCKILAIDSRTKTLTLLRGYIRQASDHTAGTRIASHISYWPETWVMNITDACPEQFVYGVKGKVNYQGYYFALAMGESTGIYPPGYHSPEDLRDLSVYTGIALDGMDYSQAFRERLKQHIGKLSIIRNNQYSDNISDYQGEILVTNGWATADAPWWERLLVRYLRWPKGSVVLFEVYEDESLPQAEALGKLQTSGLAASSTPNYQRMRFGLATALMGNGYFSYALKTHGHSALDRLWFDEYDLGAGKRGYLGYPKEDAWKNDDGVSLRRFTKGIAIANPTDFYQTVKLGAYYQHINGTQAPDVNTGQIVQEVTLKPNDGVVLLKLPLIYQWTYISENFQQ